MNRRLSKEKRREQLLNQAEYILASQGADALTLITLADAAGVTKALTYDHFLTREGLLSALYQRYDEEVVAATRKMMRQGETVLINVSRAVAASYIDCALRCGVQYESVVSALEAYPSHHDIRIKIRRFFIGAYSQIFSIFLPASKTSQYLRVTAVFGAIEEVARAVVAGEVGSSDAVPELAIFIAATISSESSQVLQESSVPC